MTPCVVEVGVRVKLGCVKEGERVMMGGGGKDGGACEEIYF